MGISRLRFPGLYWRNSAAAHHAAVHGCPGMDFFHFGRKIAWRLLRSAKPGLMKTAATLAVWPVSITRYFEFDFVRMNLKSNCGDCLDVSSPRLFSFYVADLGLAKSVTVMNPDENDIKLTSAMAKAAHLSLKTEQADMSVLQNRKETYDTIWSISVIEHVSGAYDDRQAIQWLYGALKPGGRLILTVPVEPAWREDYRDNDAYGIDPAVKEDKFFFQRVYSGPAIQKRLIDPIGNPSVRLAWFGERKQGHYMEYERRWQAQGLECTVEDPREIADHWQPYNRWEDMVGHGVCALVIDKPAAA